MRGRPELALDHRRAAPPGPALGREAGRAGPAPQDPAAPAPRGGVPGGRATRRAAPPQPPHSLVLPALLPPRHRRATDAQLPGDLGLSQSLGLQEPRRSQAALLPLLTGEPRRFPTHCSTSQRSHAVSCYSTFVPHIKCRARIAFPPQVSRSDPIGLPECCFSPLQNACY
jgi:hypothetical protein